MKYQLKITSKKKSYIIKASLTINEVAYWQERIKKLMPDSGITAMVAK